MKALGGGGGKVSSCLPCHLVWFSLKLSDKPINPIEKKLIKITSQKCCLKTAKYATLNLGKKSNNKTQDSFLERCTGQVALLS